MSMEHYALAQNPGTESGMFDITLLSSIGKQLKKTTRQHPYDLLRKCKSISSVFALEQVPGWVIRRTNADIKEGNLSERLQWN